jgi:hypothetical protein
MLMKFLNNPHEIEKFLIEYEESYLRTGKKFLTDEEYDFLYKRMIRLYKEKNENKL